ncbi:hypothetical protein TRIUR3_29863 [Triticum urartu]|uniref:Uncharacterized protein n=1 Tax=Triticum urartu TaxID=4572 RepID=M7ZKP6_TRIUA|nr:hypothetical protein TRIUR3_29863 [Triticum urartu]
MAFPASPEMGHVGSFRRPQLTFQAPPPRPAGQRQRKKMRLPEVQQLVRSLAVENESLHEEMRELQRACSALSKENDKLETRIEQSNSRNEAALKEQKGKQQQQLDQQQQQLDQQQQQSPHDSFALPDLNLPAQDGADGSGVTILSDKIWLLYEVFDNLLYLSL